MIAADLKKKLEEDFLGIPDDAAVVIVGEYTPDREGPDFHRIEIRFAWTLPYGVRCLKSIYFQTGGGECPPS